MSMLLSCSNLLMVGVFSSISTTAFGISGVPPSVIPRSRSIRARNVCWRMFSVHYSGAIVNREVIYSGLVKVSGSGY